MKNVKVKITVMVLVVILIILMIPVNVFAAKANIQVVKTENGDYIIYVEELAKTQFKFAISTKDNAGESELSYINSVNDDDGNEVALIKKENVKPEKTYIYIKNGADVKINEIDFSKESEIFDVAKMKQVETITNTIKTELLTDIEQRNEVINGVEYKETVGGLKITDDANATYYYKSVKLPQTEYSELKKLADELNEEQYKAKTMYSKIQFAKTFYEQYEEIINEVENKNDWTKVENNQIKQPSDAKKDDQYVVLLKKVAKNGEITYDAKFLTSYREDEEEKIPGRTETIVTKETSKLPVTGDNIILFTLFASIVMALVFVRIRMKKLSKKESGQ